MLLHLSFLDTDCHSSQVITASTPAHALARISQYHRCYPDVICHHAMAPFMCLPCWNSGVGLSVYFPHCLPSNSLWANPAHCSPHALKLQPKSTPILAWCISTENPLSLWLGLLCILCIGMGEEKKDLSNQHGMGSCVSFEAI